MFKCMYVHNLTIAIKTLREIFSSTAYTEIFPYYSMARLKFLTNKTVHIPVKEKIPAALSYAAPLSLASPTR